MSAFGTSEQTIVRGTARFGETRYVCDVGKMIEAILATHTAVMTETARYPCAIHLHPVDYQYLRMDHRFAPVLKDGEAAAFFMGMRVCPDSGVQKGAAQLSVCPGCLWPFDMCVNRWRP